MFTTVTVGKRSYSASWQRGNGGRLHAQSAVVDDREAVERAGAEDKLDAAGQMNFVDAVDAGDARCDFAPEMVQRSHRSRAARPESSRLLRRYRSRDLRAASMDSTNVRAALRHCPDIAAAEVTERG